MNDPYSDPNSGVLRNKLGLTDAQALADAEAKLVTVRDVEAAREPLPGIYDLTHLQTFHRRLFGDVYDWAGQLRTVDISKDNTRFCLAEHIQVHADGTVFPLIARGNYLRGRDHAGVVAAIAEQLAEVNMLHPFREGNGRAQRAFFRQMAAAAGWHLDWAAADETENIEACAAAVTGTPARLEAMIAPLVTPLPGD